MSVSCLNKPVSRGGALRRGSGRPERRRGAVPAPDAAWGPRWAGADGAECARSPRPLRSARSAGSARHPSTLLRMALSIAEGPRRPWPEYAMIQNEVDAGPRDHPSTWLGMTLSLSPFDQAHGDPEVLEGSKGQDGQPLQQFEGIEQEVRGAIRPRVPELQHDLPLGRQTEPVLRDGWPQRVPAEPLEPVPIVGRDPHAGIEVEPLLARGSTRLTAGVTAPGSGHRVLAKLVLDWHRPAGTCARGQVAVSALWRASEDRRSCHPLAGALHVDALVEGSAVAHRGRAVSEEGRDEKSAEAGEFLHLRRVAAFVAHDHGPNPSTRDASTKSGSSSGVVRPLTIPSRRASGPRKRLDDPRPGSRDD